MQEMDCVEVIVEKEKYAKYVVHCGMQGWICWRECIDNAWLVDFPQPMDKPQIATIGIHEADMKVISQMDPVLMNKSRRSLRIRVILQKPRLKSLMICPVI